MLGCRARGPRHRLWRGLRALAADDAGMVTVEAAYAIAAIVVTVLLSVGAVAGVSAQIRCTDAAREVARLVAAGDRSARAVGAELVGAGAQIVIDQAPDRITVEVSSPVAMLPGLRVAARAVAAPEPRGSDQVVFAPGVAG